MKDDFEWSDTSLFTQKVVQGAAVNGKTRWNHEFEKSSQSAFSDSEFPELKARGS